MFCRVQARTPFNCQWVGRNLPPVSDPAPESDPGKKHLQATQVPKVHLIGGCLQVFTNPSTTMVLAVHVWYPRSALYIVRARVRACAYLHGSYVPFF